MKSLWSLAAVPAVCLVTWSIAAPSRANQQPLVQEQHAAAEDEFDEATWRASLRDTDLDRRETAFDRIVEAAGRQPAARRALERWSWEQADRELAWTARLALRELDKPQPVSGLLDSGRPLDVSEFERLFRRSPFGGDPLGRELESWLEDIQRPGAQIPWSSSSSSVNVRQTPNGVTIEITEDGETRRYEGTSPEDVLRAHPELEGKLSIGPGGGIRLQSRVTSGAFDGRLQRLFEELDGRPLIEPWQPLNRAPRTDVLGVRVDASADAPGQPLVVRSVDSGTLAEKLGVQAGDELVDLNGTRLRTRGDIARVLSERTATEELELTVIRGAGDQLVLRWSPKD